MKVEVLIEKDETGYYVADVPALPGCISQGKTIAEAKENIKEAIELWVEVMNEKTHFPPLAEKDKKHYRKRIAIVV
jgi:predicted RNase H-like HicB family nuclease